ncbi:NACHT domain-containing protein [Shewanella mangrovisoli]|uniref:NACHT domain-containing protein n=1 Tax=Shewanella mangrovisoli TaxID=2864211 RepID=UPI003709FF83
MLEQVVVTESFKAIFNEAIAFVKSKSKSFKTLNQIKLEDAYAKAANVENVKTIWQIDKSVNLNEFYHPSTIKVLDQLICVDSLNIFPENGKIVIQGTAGQGKSILLRYLAGVNLKKGKTIPIFIELRKITEKANLSALMAISMSELGINIEEKDLEFIFSSGKFTLLLDAFDEIPESCLKDTLLSIENICARNYNQQIIITSRPGSDIQKVSYFSVYNLQPLKPPDFKPMLQKFFDDEVTVHRIMKALNENNSTITKLITTPLLLTLLAITYKTYHKIPTQLHEFYENIFHVLANRHDATKPGFRREYKSGLNERELEDLFCAFCFYSMIEDKSSLSRQEALSVTKKAIHFLSINPISEFSFLSDCIKNTCLLLEEGFSYHYIHKSIREYHSAKFISISPIELKEKFYTIATSNFYKYRVELEFLKVIDEHCFYKNFFLPIYRKIFDDLGISTEYREVNYQELLLDSKIIFEKHGSEMLLHAFAFSERPALNLDYMNDLHDKLLNSIFKLVRKFEINQKQSEHILITEIIKNEGLEDEFNILINECIETMFKRYSEANLKFRSKNELISNMSF